MKKFIPLFILFSFSLAIAQQKYYIFFTDKGISQNLALKKTSQQYSLAEKQLSQRSIERRKAVMGENYITFEDLPLSENYVSQVENLGVTISNKLKWFNAVTAYLTDAQAAVIGNLSFVKSVQSVPSIKVPDVIPGDESGIAVSVKSLKKTAYNLDYGNSLTQDELSRIPEVHDLGFNGNGVVIGLLDTGFRWKNHPALESRNVISEYDFINKDFSTANDVNDASNQDSHGTSVFSIIGGYAPGSLIGPAYGASYLLAKTEYVPTETHAEEDNYAAALEWMEAQGVDITSSSLGYNTFDSPETSYPYSSMNGNTTIVAKALNLAFDRGVSTFTAAGNEGGNSWYYIISPGDAYNVITVGSVTSKNVRSSFSSHGPTSDGRIKPEIVAMGSSIYNASVLGSYNTGSGTSFATPIAAGIGAQLKSAYPHLTNTQIRQIFLACGDSAGTPNNNVGYGLISALKAVCYPNISISNNLITLHKISVDSNNTVPAALTLYYKMGNNSYQQAAMQQDGTVKFQYQFPVISSNTLIEFYFKYTDSKGSEVREPSNGVYHFTAAGTANSPVTSVDDKNEIPSGFRLYANYPNPFNPSTRIRFQIPAGDVLSEVEALVTLKIFDVLGREVATLVNGVKSAGNYEVSFNAENLPSGVYFYRLQAGGFSDVKKMMLIK